MRSNPVAPISVVRIEAEPPQVRLRRFDGLDQGLHALFYRFDNLPAFVAVVAQRILRQRLTQALQHAVVVDDQAEILAGIDPVGPRDRLHQRVRLHRLVDVEGRQAFHVEARHPHRADDGDTEGMLRVLEGGLHIDALAVCGLETPLHTVAMGDDVETPLLEVGDLVLCLADDDLDDRVVQPGRLGRQLVSILHKLGTVGLVTRLSQPRLASRLPPRGPPPPSLSKLAG